MTHDLIIIGAGAAGLAAANEAESRGLHYIVLEAAPKPGKKLLATGNGKGNLCNIEGGKRFYNTDFVEYVLNVYTPQYIIHYFEGLGLKTKLMDKRVYPHTESSSTVLDILLKNAYDKIITNYRVKKIEKVDGLFVINDEHYSENVLFCTGSNATSGSDSLSLLLPFGHRIKPFAPALVPLVTEIRYLKGLSGIRVKARARLLESGREVAQQDGEVLFKDNGISGIAVFMLSTYISRSPGDYTVSLDLAYDITEQHIADFPIEGILRRELAANVLKQAKDSGRSKERTIKDFRIKVLSVGDIKHAQVCTGGLLTEDFNKITLESKLVKGLYAAGEALNVDGECGGYNLHWAFASAINAVSKLPLGIGQ
ncbi:MAG: NAD(P)/FAD-dependent oxidoreductase [Clostridia bacterium]|nr:NAD(P)/FAD-dependent oxidoreductase [Clostridia bacterium]